MAEEDLSTGTCCEYEAAVAMADDVRWGGGGMLKGADGAWGCGEDLADGVVEEMLL